jgi:predicted AlkP superfamily pyrophosphatase or phosphodiesterase
MRLLLISLDGLWEKDFSLLVGLPYIGQMIRSGVSCANVQTIYPALTYPVHATILTGCRPDLHGIAHNQPFSPDLTPAYRPWYWEASQIKRPTLHQLIHEKGGNTASILWPVTGKSPYIHWNFPEVLALPGENQTLKMLHYGSALWILAMEARYGRQRKSIHQPDLDDYAALLAEKLLLSRRPPDFLSLHLVDCDEMRHLYGADSPEAKESIRRLDRRVGKLLTALDRRRLGSDTVVAIVSDHGLFDVSRSVSLDDALQKAGLGGICRAQSTGMGAYLHFASSAADNMERILMFLEENRNSLGILRIYNTQELAKMGAGQEIRLAVEAAPDVAFVDDLALEKRAKATHGFGPGHPAAQCLFVLKGPGIRKGEILPNARMEDIAPTLMRALSYNMPSAQGIILPDCFE